MTPQPSQQSQEYLRRAEASAYIEAKYNQPCAKATLATMATKGGGPKFYRFGNTVLYSRDDLDAWALERLGRAVRSTSELRQAARDPSPA